MPKSSPLRQTKSYGGLDAYNVLKTRCQTAQNRVDDRRMRADECILPRPVRLALKNLQPLAKGPEVDAEGAPSAGEPGKVPLPSKAQQSVDLPLQECEAPNPDTTPSPSPDASGRRNLASSQVGSAAGSDASGGSGSQSLGESNVGDAGVENRAFTPAGLASVSEDPEEELVPTRPSTPTPQPSSGLPQGPLPQVVEEQAMAAQPVPVVQVSPPAPNINVSVNVTLNIPGMAPVTQSTQSSVPVASYPTGPTAPGPLPEVQQAAPPVFKAHVEHTQPFGLFEPAPAPFSGPQYGNTQNACQPPTFQQLQPVAQWVFSQRAHTLADLAQAEEVVMMDVSDPMSNGNEMETDDAYPMGASSQDTVVPSISRTSSMDSSMSCSSTATITQQLSDVSYGSFVSCTGSQGSCSSSMSWTAEPIAQDQQDERVTPGMLWQNHYTWSG